MRGKRPAFAPREIRRCSGGRGLQNGVELLFGRGGARYSALASPLQGATQLSQRREAFRAFEINEVVNNEKIRPSRLPVDLGNDGGESSGPAKVDPTHYKVILNNKGRYLGRFLALK